MVHIFTPLLLLTLCFHSSFAESCYTDTQRAVACYPADTSLSFERGIEATSTCGMEGPVEFAVRISVSQVDCCQVCDSRFDNSSHPTTFLTDLHIVTDETTWLSETGIYSPNTVNLTLSLPGSAELDTLQLHFTSYKPHSFYLEKSRDGTAYEVMRYFSVDCEEKYGLDPREAVLTDNQVVCEEVTNNRPGIVLYIPDQTRPIGETAPPEESDTLTNFITFSHLRVVLDGHRTYPSQPPNTPQGDQSYYYQLADLSVAGKCACNGHASQCNDVTLSCLCQHNTRGKNCEECASFYQDHPWRRGTPSVPFECRECECNSHSTSCYFNSTVYTESNSTSGGVCIGCMHNTVGIHCEICRDTFYTNATKSPSDADVCLECACNQIGVITNGVCDKTTGQCGCKENVQGRTCDKCKASFYNLSSDNTLGCSPCNCSIFGSIPANCDTSSGQCQCRENTQSRTCNECKPGYYNIMSGTMDGCLECLCDVGGSLSPVCDNSTGQCVCRTGVTGRQCSERSYGHFVPLIDYVTQEGEQGNGTFTPRLLTTGVNQEFTGTGYASLAPSNTLTFQSPISVTTSGVYQFDVKPPNIPTDSACNQQILTTTIISISDVIPGTSLHASTDVCLNSNIEYTLTVTHGSTYSTVLIDSMVLLPVSVLATLAVFNTSSSLLEEYKRECVEPRKQLNTWASVDTNFCNPITLSLSAELYNGLLPCACYTGGAIGDNCTFEGQCSCLSGVGSDRTCSMCMPGYFSLIPGMGCSVCGCIVSGSTSKVCDFANGQCDCRSLVDGDKCSECETGAYNFTSGLGCASCNCSFLGSANFQCSEGGECACRPGVEGDKCERCIDGFYGLGINGCASCNCDINGVRVGSSTCDNGTGECQCKGNVEGRMCSVCREGYFSLDGANPTGCRACYCSGRADTMCSAAMGYVQGKVSTRFNTNQSNILDSWTTLDDDGNAFIGYFPFTINNMPSIATFSTVQYLSAPAKYLTFKLSSYTQFISVQFTINPIPQTLPTLSCPPYTLLLRGYSMEIATCTQLGVADSNGFVSIDIQLHETADWIRTETGTAVTELEFLQVLASLTHLFIRGSFVPDTNTYFHQVSLPVAVRGTGTAVGWVESCLCNANYSGPSCTKCAPGFYRQTDGSCIQCDCFGNSSQLSCDPNTGECVVCPPSTTGASCESCVPGYYGSPSDGISCLPCACPGQYSGSFSPLCELIPPAFLPTDTPPGQDLECTNCSRGHEGMRCELCQENYYGDPVNSIGCIPCDCNDNIALEEPGNCNNSSGVCLRCVGNTAGQSCQVCATGFYGDAIQAKNCSRCMCDLMGAENQDCDTATGQCVCRPNTEGRQCAECVSGYFNISSGTGCRECGCSTTGAVGRECNVTSGQCLCQPGVTGLTCDRCKQDFYGFSLQGCSPCDCFQPGSITNQCDSIGICVCKEGVFGDKCNKCSENFYDVTRGCIPCPECYQELQGSINSFRSEITNLSAVVNDLESTQNDIPFTTRLNEATMDINNLVSDARGLQEMEQLSLMLTSQLHYTTVYLRNFVADTFASIDTMENQVSFIGSQAIAAAVLVNETILNMQDISDYLRTDPRAYLELAQTLVNVSVAMGEIARQMGAVSNLHKQQADQIEEFIREAGVLSSQASNSVMRSYQRLITSITPSIQTLTLLLNSIYTHSNLLNTASVNELNMAMQQMSEATQLIIQARTPNRNDEFNTTEIQSTLIGFQLQADDVIRESIDLKIKIEPLTERIQILFGNLIQYSSDIVELTETDATYRERALAANYKSVKARNLGNKLVAMLNETLIIIADFNASSNTAQREARESLQKVSFIQEISRQAERNVSQVLREFSIASRKSRESYTNSVRAGEIANSANNLVDRFLGQVSGLSEELSQYTVSFNTTLLLIQDIATRAVTQDEIMNGLRTEAIAQADICIQKAQEISNFTQTTINEINRLYTEINEALITLQPPQFDIDEFAASVQLLNETIFNAQLRQTVMLLKQRLNTQIVTKLEIAGTLSKLKEDLYELQNLERTLPKSCNTGS